MKATFTKFILFTAGIIFLNATCVNAQLVTTFAGNTFGTGYTNDTGLAASFNWPISLAFDKQHNIYVADADNNVIRKIIMPNTVTTFAGSGATGITNDTGIAASFNHPLCVAVDTAGDVYVSDSKNNMIRKITPSGLVSLFAGSGLTGSVNGAAANATFNYPNGIATDKNGNIYVADSRNNMIRKISHSDTVSTVAGSTNAGSNDDTGVAAGFNYPTGIAVDSNGNLFVADENNNLIRKITPAGVVTTFAGSGIAGYNDDTGRAAAFNAPYGITIDKAGNLYVAEIGNNTIRAITPSKKVTTIAGIAGVTGSDDGLKDVATFYNPTGVLPDNNGNLFVADWNNNEIRKIILGYTGIFTPRPNNTILISPNPAHDVLNIPTQPNDKVIIYNLMGAEVYRGFATNTSTLVPVNNFCSGTYSVQVTGRSGNIKSGKFVKE